jgi:hypothetical protein
MCVIHLTQKISQLATAWRVGRLKTKTVNAQLLLMLFTKQQKSFVVQKTTVAKDAFLHMGKGAACIQTFTTVRYATKVTRPETSYRQNIP